MSDGRIKILRIIARLNMGGPAHQACLLSGRRMDPRTYETLLVHGRPAAGEGSLEDLVGLEGVHDHRLESLSPAIDPRADAVALRELIGLIRRFEPDIVHTHTAKAGFLGRRAALIASIGRRARRPVLVHTFHGHVLEGYFGRAKEEVYRTIERSLAKRTDRLIGVSEATVDDLVRLRIAPRERFAVVPLGLDLTRFAPTPAAQRAQLRRELGVADDEIVVSFVGRLVPIKRLDVLLRAIAHARSTGLPLRLVVVGDGELRERLTELASELGIATAISWLGFRRDLPELAAAADIAALSSDNEGTPVSLIEAAASGLPCVSTDVGGVGDVVLDGTSGTLVPAGDHASLAARFAMLAADPALRHEMGAAGREHVLTRFSVERLISDIAALYGGLLALHRPPSAD